MRFLELRREDGTTEAMIRLAAIEALLEKDGVPVIITASGANHVFHNLKMQGLADLLKKEPEE